MPTAGIVFYSLRRVTFYSFVGPKAASKEPLFRIVRSLLDGQLIVGLDVGRLPGVADPDVADGASGHVAVFGEHVMGQLALLLLVLVLTWVESY